MSGARRGLGALLAAIALLLAPAVAAGAERTQLLSRSATGGFPNGPSSAGAISQDRQLAGLAAFSSEASDIAAGDGNGAVSDVFVVQRADALADALRGLPWEPAGPARLVSRGLAGQPANGPSWGTDLDGSQVHDGLDERGRPTGADAPHCVAFVSAASNLVAGDTNGVPDAFVADLRRGGRVERVSVDSRGRQASGPTYEVEVDGGCRRVALTADAPELALTAAAWRAGGRREAWRPAMTRASRRGVPQVYVRVLPRRRADGDDAGLAGLTFLASSRAGRPGNGASYDLALGQLGRGRCGLGCAVRSGDALAYASTATNLAPGDPTPRLDVYRTTFRRTLPRAPRGRRAPAGPGPLAIETRLVSATRSGIAGDGPSGQPSIDHDGRYVAFATEATDVLACVRLSAGVVCDGNGVSDVARADMAPARPRVEWVSASAALGEPGNAPSGRPASTRYGSVLFESDASNLQRTPVTGGRLSDRNGIRDVFLWSERTRSPSLQSRDSADGALAAPRGGDDPAVLGAPTTGPATSAYNNYVLWETANPVVELPLAQGAFPELAADRDAAAAAAASDPSFRQVYLRYVGRR